MTRVMIRAADQTFIATRFRFTPRERVSLFFPSFLDLRFPIHARLDARYACPTTRESVNV